LPRLDAGEMQRDPKREQEHPPGQFISDEHEADCSRFLQEVKEFIRHRSELGLGRER
jgi:hypothetical protein